MARSSPYVQNQGVVGYEDYPDWEGWSQEWPGTAADDPTSVPPAIEGDWSFNFRPEEIASELMPGGQDAYEGYVDWAQGAGVTPRPFGMFNDQQYIDAYGGLPFQPRTGPDPQALTQAGYTFGLDPKDTANRSWALDYNVFDPEGHNIGYALSAPESTPYKHFPWVPGGEPYTQDPNWNPDTTTTPPSQATCEAGGGTWNGFECIQPVSGVTADGGIVRPITGLPDAWGGMFDPVSSDIPFTPEPFAEAASIGVGEDPLSKLTSANLASMLTTGGVAPTPLAGNIEQTLQDILGARGAGGEAVSPLGQQAAGELGQVLGAQGDTPRTALAQQTASGLGEILGTGGERAGTQLGQDVTGQLQNLLATGGALPSDPQREAMEIESARTPLDVLRRAQLSQGQAALAEQGLVGSGAGREYLERLEQRLSPMYTQAAQEIELGRRQREQERYGQALGLGTQQAAQQETARDTRLSTAMTQAQTMSAQEAALRQSQYLNALQQATGMSSEQADRRENRLQQAMSLATGMSQEQSRNLLATAQTVNQRQQMMNDIAISILDRNMQWNEFLATYGLDRARTLETLQQGRIATIQPLLELYLRVAEDAQKGAVGAPRG
jgi:hypothetical protein